MRPTLEIPRLSLAERDRRYAAVRKQMAAILGTVPDADFQRVGRHSEAGSLTLRTFLERITGHIPHHTPFIAEKRRVLARG